MRKWRRQPRKRSQGLFWTLLSLALLCDSGLLVVAARLVGIWGPATTLFHPIRVGGMERGDTSSRRAFEVEENSRAGPHLARERGIGGISSIRQALYWSIVTAGLFAAAAAVRRWEHQWRRAFLLVGLMTCLGCLGWSSWALLGPAIQTGAAILGNGTQGILWFSAVVMGLGLLLGLLCRDVFFALAGALISSIGFSVADRWPLAFIELVSPLSGGAANNSGLQAQTMILLSAYAALTLAWGVSALALARIIRAAPSRERLSRPAALSLLPICLGMALLAASALLDGWRALEHGPSWHVRNMQMVGTLVVLPACAALVYARRFGRMPPFRFLTSVTLGFAFLAMVWHGTLRARSWDVHYYLPLDLDAGPYVAGLLSLCLAAHAALSYYFGRQCTLEV